jgi:integrase
VANSTRRKRPAKPRPDFPLFPHATGRWTKKVRGKHHYFGKIADDPKGEAALLLWLDQKDDLLAGRTPRAGRDGLTIKALCDRFCTVKEDQAEAGDITRQTFLDYHRTCKAIVDAFGRNRLVEDLAADDFEALRASFAKRCNPNTLGNEVQRVRVCFKYAYDAGLIDRPVRFGPTFKRPAKRILRAVRQQRGSRMFEARQLRRLLKAAPNPLQAMILLGVNCGFGNNDCGTLPLSAVDLKGGWINFPRPKTAVDRRCPLWPETIEALKAAIAARPEPKDPEHAGLVFLTKYGQPWGKHVPTINPISAEMRKLLDKLNLYRRGLSFYRLRHVHETIAGEGRDQVAVDAIMGHTDGSMAGVYREKISDDRLRDAANVIRKWLFRRESQSPWRAAKERRTK